jgi:hypothetical protein
MHSHLNELALVLTTAHVVGQLRKTMLVLVAFNNAPWAGLAPVPVHAVICLRRMNRLSAIEILPTSEVKRLYQLFADI